jgi:hypothetical protein
MANRLQRIANLKDEQEANGEKTIELVCRECFFSSSIPRMLNNLRCVLRHTTYEENATRKERLVQRNAESVAIQLGQAA